MRAPALRADDRQGVGRRRASLFAGAAALAEPLFAPADAGELPADTSFATLHGLYWLLNNLADRRRSRCSSTTSSGPTPSRSGSSTTSCLGSTASPLPSSRAPARRRRTGDLRRLSSDAATVVLRPALSAAATATVCRAQLGDDVTPDLTTACWEATGGNPFLLDALLHEAADHAVGTDAAGAAQIRRMGPSSVAQSVLLRLAEPTLAALVRAVAVLGDGARLVEAAALAGVAVDVAAEAADRLVALHVLSPGDVLEFAHPIVREAVYADIGRRQRADAHARAARMLDEVARPTTRSPRSWCWPIPPATSVGSTLLRRVAVDALRRGAPATAVALLQRALDEPPPADETTHVLLELAAAELRVGSPDAIDHLAEGRRPAARPGLAGGRGAAARQRADVGRPLGRVRRRAARARSTSWRRRPRARAFLEADLAAHAQEASLDARARQRRGWRRTNGCPARRRASVWCWPASRSSTPAPPAPRPRPPTTSGGRSPAGACSTSSSSTSHPRSTSSSSASWPTDALDVADDVLDRMLADARRVVSVPAIAFVLAHQAPRRDAAGRR